MATEGRRAFPSLAPASTPGPTVRLCLVGRGPSMQTPRGMGSLCPAQEISGQPQHRSGFWQQALRDLSPQESQPRKVLAASWTLSSLETQAHQGHSWMGTPQFSECTESLLGVRASAWKAGQLPLSAPCPSA
ncbi:unnamed protein product [Gulo gulo]|uniref:Uncharacterized protein n=1 Tax=Gulo gulo TaxID=48420 RepID=A0A9X9LP01_GULGU|nr:unnamed protein product [Gulo gulo]